MILRRCGAEPVLECAAPVCLDRKLRHERTASIWRSKDGLVKHDEREVLQWKRSQVWCSKLEFGLSARPTRQQDRRQQTTCKEIAEMFGKSFISD